MKITVPLRNNFNNISFILIFILVAMNSIASPVPAKGEITGKVIDAANNQPLQYATVSVYTKADSSLITGGITSKDGTFELDVPEGNYLVVVQFISYEKEIFRDIQVSGSHSTVNVGKVMLQPNATELAEATITGEKSEMVIGLDRRVFNVGKDLSNSGQSASEILDNIPSVTVDLEGNVSLRGSQNVQILVNGKPSGLISAENTDALRNLQGNLIERVEVITNPSAKYEAEGMAGIINIVLKKDERKGVNGSFEVAAGYPHDYEVGANVNFRRPNINYFLNYGVDYDERPGSGSRFQEFMYPDTSYYTDMERDRLRTGWSHNLRGGADYYLNDRNTLTASVFVGISDEKNTTTIWYRDLDGTRQEFLETIRKDNEQEVERNIEFSLNYDLTFDQENRKFNAFVQYIEEGEREESDIREVIDELFGEQVNDEDPLLQQVLNEESESDWLIQADYTHPFGNEGRFEAGYRSELRFIKNPYRVEEQDEQGDWVKLDAFTNDFDYTENVHALYTQAGNKFGDWSLQLGLRAELSDVRTHLKNTGEQNNRSYFDLFPTIHTSYKFDDVNSVQLSYSRRINRPHFWYLNPFNNFTDARNIRTGNPNLDPEYTGSYDLGYLMSNGQTRVYAGGYYRNTSDVIERISEVDDQGITYLVPYNLAEQQSFGVESNVSVDPYDWWTVAGDINFFRAITSGNYLGEDLSSDTYSWNSRLNSNMRFDNDLDVQAVFYYRGPQETTQGVRKAFYMLNLGVSKDILKGDGTLTLNVRDVLNSRVYRYILDRPNLYSENEFRWSTRSVSLSFIYRLNQQKKTGHGRNGQGFGGGDEMGI